MFYYFKFFFFTTIQNYDITGEALDTWFRCDSKWRRSPEGGEDNQSNNCQKIKEDAESIESDNLNNSLLDVSVKKKEKSKKEKM